MKTHQKSDPKMEPKSIKNHSKIDAKKETKRRGSNRYPAWCGQSPNPIISKDTVRSKHTKKAEWGVSTRWSAKSGVQKASAERQVQNEGWVQSGVQKVGCKRQVQKGKCRQGTHYARKHARWPATTCGSLTRIPPGQGLGLLRSPTSTKTEQKWDPNRAQMGPIWAREGEGAPENQRKYEKVKKMQT